MPLPLPSLAEQAAIVERVKSVMATCHELEAEIEHSRTHAADLVPSRPQRSLRPRFLSSEDFHRGLGWE